MLDVNVQMGRGGSGEAAHQPWGTGDTPTPGHGRAGDDGKIVLAIAKGLNRLDVDSSTIAFGLDKLSSGVQRNLFEIILKLFGIYTRRYDPGSGQPLEMQYGMAATMLDSITPSGDKG